MQSDVFLTKFFIWVSCEQFVIEWTKQSDVFLSKTSRKSNIHVKAVQFTRRWFSKIDNDTFYGLLLQVDDSYDST